MPVPLSKTAIYASPRGKKKISDRDADAAILLSIISATAVSKEYPTARVDSISMGAYGGNIFSLITFTSVGSFKGEASFISCIILYHFNKRSQLSSFMQNLIQISRISFAVRRSVHSNTLSSLNRHASHRIPKQGRGLSLLQLNRPIFHYKEHHMLQQHMMLFIHMRLAERRQPPCRAANHAFFHPFSRCRITCAMMASAGSTMSR